MAFNSVLLLYDLAYQLTSKFLDSTVFHLKFNSLLVYALVGRKHNLYFNNNIWYLNIITCLYDHKNKKGRIEIVRTKATIKV